MSNTQTSSGVGDFKKSKHELGSKYADMKGVAVSGYGELGQHIMWQTTFQDLANDVWPVFAMTLVERSSPNTPPSSTKVQLILRASVVREGKVQFTADTLRILIADSGSYADMWHHASHEILRVRQGVSV